MIKATLGVLVLLMAVACGTAPAPTRSNVQAFTVISEQADPAAGSLTLLIKVSDPLPKQTSGRPPNPPSQAERASTGTWL